MQAQIDCVRIRVHLEKNLRRYLVTLIYNPMQRRMTDVVPLVNRDVMQHSFRASRK
jgi:hypothetical protein